MKTIPVIMAGGGGTRLWPMSSSEKPKQFHNLSGGGTLLEETAARLLPLNPERFVIVTSKNYEKLSLDELGKFSTPGTVLCEPAPKNTAAAVLYGAVYLSKLYGDCVMIMLPADHYMKNNDEFARILKIGVTAAEEGNLVTIGIKPSYPETGYGYIRSNKSGMEVRKVEKFVEKPDIGLAREYVASGNYFWNSGIFLWKASVIIESFKKHLPGFVKTFEKLASLEADKISSDSADVWEIKREIFSTVESVSIDVGILEKAENCVVIPGDFGWADLGSWKSVDDILMPDGAGNRTPDKDASIFVGSKNCSVFSEGSRIAVVGLSDVVVVQSGNDILVINKESSQEVRKVVDIINGKKEK